MKYLASSLVISSAAVYQSKFLLDGGTLRGMIESSYANGMLLGDLGTLALITVGAYAGLRIAGGLLNFGYRRCFGEKKDTLENDLDLGLGASDKAQNKLSGPSNTREAVATNCLEKRCAKVVHLFECGRKKRPELDKVTDNKSHSASTDPVTQDTEVAAAPNGGSHSRRRASVVFRTQGDTQLKHAPEDQDLLDNVSTLEDIQAAREAEAKAEAETAAPNAASKARPRPPASRATR